MFMPNKNRDKRHLLQIDNRSFSRTNSFKSLPLELENIDLNSRAQNGIASRSNTNGLDKRTVGNNDMPPLLVYRDNINSTKILHLSKRSVDLATLKKRANVCKSFQITALTASSASAIAGAASGVSIFTAGVALAGVAASEGARLSAETAYLELDCSAIPFEEIGEILDERLNKVDKALDRNFNAINRNFESINRNYVTLQLWFKESEHRLKQGLESILAFVRHSRIEDITSRLITFIEYFFAEANALKELPKEQLIAKLKDPNGILEHLKDARTPKSATSLHTLLSDIINQRFAIPENAADKIAFITLDLLHAGTMVYVSIASFLPQGYAYLADAHYQENDIEKYNQYLTLAYSTFKDFKNSLQGVHGNDGLIDKVIRTLSEIKELDSFLKNKKNKRSDIISKINALNQIKSELVAVKNLSEDRPTEQIKFDFSKSAIKTPFGVWEDRRRVSYAIQFKDDWFGYPVGDWSIPYRVYGKANPTLDIGIDPKGRTRLIFRRFDSNKPELVGIVKDSNQNTFKDINRDLYNAASEPNEELAIDEIKVLIKNGADVQAIYEQGRQAVHAAARSGSLNVTLTLKENGANIHAKDANGYAPIHVAAEAGYEKFVIELMVHGADINAKTHLNWTPLHIAAYQGHVATVANLIHSSSMDINARTQGGFTALHMAAASGKRGVVDILSQDDRVYVNAPSETGLTPLHVAAIGKYDHVVETLLKSNKVHVNAEANGNLTALHFATSVGNLGITKLLIGNSKVNVNAPSISGWTSLHLAIALKKEDLALELLKRDDIKVSIQGEDGLTPLHLAVITEQKSIILNLLNKGAQIEERDQQGYMPLHLATAKGDLGIIQFLIAHGASLNAKQKDGYTSLFLAVIEDNLDLISFFVDQSADINEKDNDGNTALHKAASRGHNQVITTLFKPFENHSTALRTFIQTQSNDGNTALHKAASRGHDQVITTLFKPFEDNAVALKEFIKMQDKDGETALHDAALHGKDQAISALLKPFEYNPAELKVFIQTQDKHGHTALHEAAFVGNTAVLSALLKPFRDNPTALKGFIRTKDNDGYTALHKAALNDRVQAIAVLLKPFEHDLAALRDFIKTQTKDGWTALHEAASVGNAEIISALLNPFEADLRASKTFIQTKDNDGYTALHKAALNGKDQAIAALLKPFEHDSAALKEILKTQDKDGNTALYRAALEGMDQVIAALQKPFSADPATLKEFIQTKDNNGYTALHKAALEGKDQAIAALLKPFEHDPTALKEILKTQDKDGNTALHEALKQGYYNTAKKLLSYLYHMHDNWAAFKQLIQATNNNGKKPFSIAKDKNKANKIIAEWINHADRANAPTEIVALLNSMTNPTRQKREISKTSEALVDPKIKGSSSLTKDAVEPSLIDTVTNHSVIQELSPIAAHDLKQPVKALASTEAFVTSSVGKSTSWMDDLWAWGKKLMIGSSYSKPVSLDPLEAPLSSKPVVCSDLLNTGAPPIRPTTGPIVLDMGDQWVKNSDTNGLLTWGALLARKWTGSRSKAAKAITYDPAIGINLGIQSHAWVDAFMDEVQDQARACGIEKATSAIFDNPTLYTKAVQMVHKKIAAGQVDGITVPLFEKVVQHTSNKIAATATSDQVDQWLANVRETLPKLEQQFLEQAAPLQNSCQEEGVNTTSKPNIKLLKEAMSSMPSIDQLADISLHMGNIHNMSNTLVQRPGHDNPYGKRAGFL